MPSLFLRFPGADVSREKVGLAMRQSNAGLASSACASVPTGSPILLIMSKPDPAKTLFVLSAALLVFAAGFVVGTFKVFPYSLIRSGARSVQQVFRERETLARIRPMELTQPARIVGKGLTINKPGTQPGLTLVASFFSDGDNEIRLMRLDGSLVNRWPVRFFDLFPSQAHIDSAYRPQSEWNVHTHGAMVLPDGSLLVSDDEGGAIYRITYEAS